MLRTSCWVVLYMLSACTPELQSFPDLAYPPVTVTEGKSTTFMLGIGTGHPDADVRGTFNPQNGVVSIAPLEFDLKPPAFREAITVSASHDMDTAKNDTIDIDPTIYGDIGSYFPVSIVDADAMNLDASPWNLALAPTETSSFGVRLTQPPSGPIDVSIESNDPSIAVVTPTVIDFAPTNYSVSQNVTVMAIGQGIVGISLLPANGISSERVVVTVSAAQ